jgi:hypothetical protein
VRRREGEERDLGREEELELGGPEVEAIAGDLVSQIYCQYNPKRSSFTSVVSPITVNDGGVAKID